MIETLSINELEKRAGNIYEAIIVLARRARQINDDQKQVLQRERTVEEDYEEYREEDFAIPTDYVKLPKPSDESLKEFMTGALQHRYQPDEENEDASSKS